MKCNNCGKKIPNGMMFCPDCGCKCEEKTDAEYEEKKDRGSIEKVTDKCIEKPKNIVISQKKLIIIVGIVGLIFGAIISALIVYFIFSTKENVNKISNSQQESIVSKNNDSDIQNNINSSSSDKEVKENEELESQKTDGNYPVVIEDNDKFTFEIINYDDLKGTFAVTITNKTDKTIIASEGNSSALLDGKNQCEINGAYMQIPANENSTTFIKFTAYEDDNIIIYTLSNNHTFEFTINVFDGTDYSWNKLFKIKLSPDMFGF